MFQRVLIANRGEVAVRIARACRSLGIAPIGIASEADRGAPWLGRMEEVVEIGGFVPAESYLRAERVLQAALQTRCTAIHPGWGFLAEDPRFAALCEQHGITWIGPSPEVMQRMALKTPAKTAMLAAGLQGIPGSDGLLTGVEDARQRAEEVGYPVIIKADAGGGGRGMRLCRNEEELVEGYASARAEAQGAFGNGALYLERYLEGGRHIEVQILADRFGKAIHLGERECSVQRNHQKLIEECPSPALTKEERQRLGRSAARAAASIGYVGAGTIEFLLEDSGQLCFIEMNTRLQVEHPITEAVTGIDIVQKQLEIAAHQPLTLKQVEVSAQGNAIECRINAEDPSNGFKPSPGILERFEIATDVGPGLIRVDTHLQQGDEVSPYYDSLLAKVIGIGKTRDHAIETLLASLKASKIEGVATTLPMHLEVLNSREFRKGEYDTSRIPGWSPESPTAAQ
jgi:acetyl-CoA carboxylase biotin carboxylase subunit